MQNNENVKIKEMYREERPYEKCEQYGAENLTDAELLAVLLRTGTKGENSLRLAQKILHPETDRGGLVNLPQWTVEQLRQVRGIGKVKAIQIRCLAELARRMAKAEALEGLDFSSPNTIALLTSGGVRVSMDRIASAHSSKGSLTAARTRLICISVCAGTPEVRSLP